jgi:hypothetical protein
MDEDRSGQGVMRFGIEEVSKSQRQWTMELHSSHLALRPMDEEQPYVFLRADLFKKVDFMPRARLLMVKEPFKLGFKLSAEAMSAFTTWVGTPGQEQLAIVLKRRYALSLPVAALFIITSLPMAGDPGAGVQALQFKPLNFLLGFSLAVMWLFSKIKPHPVLFLLDAVWMFTLAGYLAVQVLQGRSLWWSVFMIALVWLAIGGLTRFRQFGGMSGAR